MKTDKKNNPFDFKLLSRVLSFVQPYKLIFYSSIVFSILLGVFSIGRPILIEYTVDNFIIGSNPEMLLKYCLIMVGLLVLEAIFQFVFMYAANWIGQSVIKDIRKKLFEKILSFRLKYFDETPIGALVTRTSIHSHGVVYFVYNHKNMIIMEFFILISLSRIHHA